MGCDEMQKESRSKREVNRQKIMYKKLYLLIRNDTGIPAALFKMQDRTGIPPSTYTQSALKEKLIADGYLKEE